MTHAASGNCVSFLESLVQHGASVDTRDPFFILTPLQCACTKPIPGVMALKLLEWGADAWLKTPTTPVSYLSTLALNRLGTAMVPILKLLVQKGCTFSNSPAGLTAVYWKAVRENDHELQDYILAQPGVTRKDLEEDSILGNLLSNLVQENTISSTLTIQTLLSRNDPTSRPSLTVNRQNNSIFHVLASLPELHRNEQLLGPVASHLLGTRQPGSQILDLVNKQGQTALGLAAVTGNHTLFRLYFSHKANPLLGRCPIAALMVARIESEKAIWDRRPAGGNNDLSAVIKWQQEFNRKHRNTVRVLRVALEFLESASEESRRIARHPQSETLISQTVKKWHEDSYYETVQDKCIKQAFGEYVEVRLETGSRLQHADGSIFSDTELIKCKWMASFLHQTELHGHLLG